MDGHGDSLGFLSGMGPVAPSERAFCSGRLRKFRADENQGKILVIQPLYAALQRASGSACTMAMPTGTGHMHQHGAARAQCWPGQANSLVASHPDINRPLAQRSRVSALACVRVFQWDGDSTAVG
jgi:hypothetical protein